MTGVICKILFDIRNKINAITFISRWKLSSEDVDWAIALRPPIDIVYDNGLRVRTFSCIV